MSHLFNKKLGFWKRSKFIHTLLFFFLSAFTSCLQRCAKPEGSIMDVVIRPPSPELPSSFEEFPEPFLTRLKTPATCLPSLS